jgi:HSP20 family protein
MFNDHQSTKGGMEIMNGSMWLPRDILAEFERFQEHLNRAFPRTNFPGSIRATARGEFPAINIGSTPDTVEIAVFAPGIDPKAVELSIDNGLLTLAGERKSSLPEGSDRTSIYAQERVTGPFRRVVSLPEDADPARVTANYRDGFLRVSVGKRESSKPRRIEVQA